ncbi:MAG: hypothetical protein DRH57_05625 [Candidatus Cloacimonadota bacterium]|nr:MAG: hypothetical protein DRH57_05625 [Candidatus Cloacimonadota bacterium]
MIVSMDFEDEVFYIIPPGPDSDNFRLQKQPEDEPITIPYMKNAIYRSREQAELNLFRWEWEAASKVESIRYWRKKYKVMADRYPEYVL